MGDVEGLHHEGFLFAQSSFAHAFGGYFIGEDVMNFIFFGAGQRFPWTVIGILPNFRAGGLRKNFLAAIGIPTSSSIFLILLMRCQGIRFNRAAFAPPMRVVRLNAIFMANFADVVPDHKYFIVLLRC